MGMYASMWAAAIEFGDSDQSSAYSGDVPYYDTCPIGATSGGLIGLGLTRNSYEYGEVDTKWTVIFALNMIVYACLTLFSICQMLGTFFWPLCCFAACGHCATSNAHLACIIVTAVFRYRSEGEKCAENNITQ